KASASPSAVAGSESPALPSLSTAWRRTCGLGLCRSAIHDFTSRPPERIGPRSSRPQPDRLVIVAASAVVVVKRIAARSFLIRSCPQYESELTTSPPARVPSAWRIRLDGVYRVEPSGFTPASPVTLRR